MRTITAAFMAALLTVVMTTAGQAKSFNPFSTYYEFGNCATSNVSGGAVDCFGSAIGPKHLNQVDVNGASYVDLFSWPQTGLFGITDWTNVYDSKSSGATFGSKSGTFDLSQSLSGSVAVMLKYGSAWSAYLFNGLSAGTYQYDISSISWKGLKEYRVVTANPIPVPAALPMLGAALGGLAMVGRRRRKAVA